MGIHWIAMNGDNVIFLDSFGHIFQKKLEIHKQKKYRNKYLQNTSK